MKLVLEYIAALVTLAVLDAIWLTLTKSFYLGQIGQFFGPKVMWWAVILFYILYAFAVVYFASSGAHSAARALLSGALLGFTAYMTYDLVNAATLPSWPIKFLVVDIAWGTLITALAALAAYTIGTVF